MIVAESNTFLLNPYLVDTLRPLKPNEGFLIYVCMIKPIEGFNKYFISSEGYCFKTYQGRDIEKEISVKKNIPRVQIGAKKLNLVNLMIEYFVENIPANYRTTYKIENGRIPIENITIKKIESENTDDIKIFDYKCSEKASSANSRFNGGYILTKYDVLDSLIRTNFRCHYCNEFLKKDTWQLDHVYPISKGGTNKPANITPSCKKCNMMKSNLGIQDFINRCGNINKNFHEYIDDERLTHLKGEVRKSVKKEILKYAEYQSKLKGRVTKSSAIRIANEYIINNLL